MAENPGDPGADNPQPVHPSGGDSAADFFDDASAKAESHPVANHVKTPAPTYIPPQVEDAHTSVAFPIFIGVLLLGFLVAAWIISKQPKEEPAPPAPDAAAAPATPPPLVSAPPPAADSLDGDVKQVKGRLESLATQMKGIEAKLEGLAKPTSEVDVKPIQGKIDDLAKSVATLAPLSDKVGTLDAKLVAIDQAVKTVKTEVSSLSNELKTIASTSNPPAADAGAVMTQGVDLFKTGKYKEAGEIFKTLETTTPNDARVYYYDALLTGLNTNDWQGAALKTAAKGAALEKAGATKPADVDAAFADLPVNLKPWLAFFRKQAK